MEQLPTSSCQTFVKPLPKTVGQTSVSMVQMWTDVSKCVCLSLRANLFGKIIFATLIFSR